MPKYLFYINFSLFASCVIVSPLVASCLCSESRELQFTTAVESIVMRGGSCLIPVFALGRAQELLLILDQYWQEHVQLQVACSCMYVLMASRPPTFIS